MNHDAATSQREPQLAQSAVSNMSFVGEREHFCPPPPPDRSGTILHLDNDGKKNPLSSAGRKEGDMTGFKSVKKNKQKTLIRAVWGGGGVEEGDGA